MCAHGFVGIGGRENCEIGYRCERRKLTLEGHTQRALECTRTHVKRTHSHTILRTLAYTAAYKSTSTHKLRSLTHTTYTRVPVSRGWWFVGAPPISNAMHKSKEKDKRGVKRGRKGAHSCTEEVHTSVSDSDNKTNKRLYK